MKQWQPIETCPAATHDNDHLSVLVLCKGPNDEDLMFHATYDKSHNRYYDNFWVPIPDNSRRKNKFGSEIIKERLKYYPTHWMPLPEPPK